MKLRDLAIALIVCVAAGTGGFFSYRALHGSAAPAALRPDLSFRDLKGVPHALSEWNGKLLLVNFWASWCAPCLSEMPMLVEAQKDHGGQGLQVLGIAMDDVAPVAKISERLQINYPVLAGGEEVAKAMDLLGDELGALPFSVLIAPDGRILDRRAGALSAGELKEWLEKLPP